MYILQSIGLEKHAKHTYKQLSGGQKQKFSIATTIINKPKIIFLDEPTTGLDPIARRQLWQQIIDLKNNGTSIVITTHYMEEAEVLCDKIAIMDKGKILKTGSPKSLIESLIATGYTNSKQTLAANLEDVFIATTGKDIYE
jgi:ABC-2 type transport system ATP-binding protein